MRQGCEVEATRDMKITLTMPECDASRLSLALDRAVTATEKFHTAPSCKEREAEFVRWLRAFNAELRDKALIGKL